MINFNMTRPVLKILNDKKEFNAFLQSLKIIKTKLKNVKIIPYVIASGYPFLNSGYASRTHHILNTFNSMYSDKQYIAVFNIGFPYHHIRVDLKNKLMNNDLFLNKLDNVFYLTLPNLPKNKSNYNQLFDILSRYFNFTTIHVASDWNNAMPIIHYCNNKSLKSIYEIRGMWHISAACKKIYFNRPINKDIDIIRPSLGERECINKCSVPLFITPQLKNYAKNESKNKIFPSLNCSFKNAPIFCNCFNTNNKIIKKEKTDNNFIIGYIGSIVYYEGLIETIDHLEKLIGKTSKNIEFHIIGDYENFAHPQKLSDCKKKTFVKFLGEVSKNEVVDKLKTFDLYVIPRLDMAVTNMVSPIKPYEPMALKIPLLMSDCDCLKDISQDGKNCMLFKKGNFDDFNKKLKHIIDNGYDESILQNGYNFVKKERNWNYMIKKIGLYELLM